MADLYSAFIAFIGAPMTGYEPVAYVLASAFGFYFVTAFFGFFVSLFRR